MSQHSECGLTSSSLMGLCCTCTAWIGQKTVVFLTPSLLNLELISWARLADLDCAPHPSAEGQMCAITSSFDMASVAQQSGLSKYSLLAQSVICEMPQHKSCSFFNIY